MVPKRQSTLSASAASSSMTWRWMAGGRVHGRFQKWSSTSGQPQFDLWLLGGNSSSQSPGGARHPFLSRAVAWAQICLQRCFSNSVKAPAEATLPLDCSCYLKKDQAVTLGLKRCPPIVQLAILRSEERIWAG